LGRPNAIDAWFFIESVNADIAGIVVDLGDEMGGELA
jgi:hypothetical protein